MSAPVHVPGPPVKQDYPGGKDGMFRVECSCGYLTGFYSSPGYAAAVALQHADAKNGVTRR